MNFWYIEHYGASGGDDFVAKKTYSNNGTGSAFINLLLVHRTLRCESRFDFDAKKN